MPYRTDAALLTLITDIKTILVADGKIDAAELQSVLTDIIDSKINNSDAASGGFELFETLTDGATVTWDCATSYNKKVTLGGNRVLSITNAASGGVGMLLVTQDGTGFRTLTLPATAKHTGGYYALSTSPGLTDLLIFIKDGSTYYWTVINNYL